LGHYHFLVRHLVFLIPALVMLFGVSMLSQKIIRRGALIGFVLCILALAAVLVVGVEIKGAQRWIHFFGFSLQPSEFIKPLFLIVSAWLLSLQKRKGNIP